MHQGWRQQEILEQSTNQGSEQVDQHWSKQAETPVHQ